MSNEKKNRNPKSNTEGREQAAETGRRLRKSNRGTGQVADWANADATLTLRCISLISARGCAIQFSYTRDSGSLVIRIVGDGEPYNEYVRPTEDVNEYLRGLAADFE